MVVSSALSQFMRSLLVLLGTCASCSAHPGAKFPGLEATTPLAVLKTTEIPEKKICEIHREENVKAFIDMLRERYPDRWRKPSPVSFAAIYRISLGDIDISLMQRGIMIASRNHKKFDAVVHDLPLGDADALVGFVCGKDANK